MPTASTRWRPRFRAPRNAQLSAFEQVLHGEATGGLAFPRGALEHRRKLCIAAARSGESSNASYIASWDAIKGSIDTCAHPEDAGVVDGGRDGRECAQIRRFR
jgi:hypothetical protein